MQVPDMSEKEFRQRFRTEAQCARYVWSRKYPHGLHCRRCGERSCYRRQKRWMVECATCGYQESPKAHTVMQGSHVPLREWCWAMYLLTVSKGGVSALELQRRLGFGSYKTAWHLLHKLRRAMHHRDGQYQLRGTVEVDTAYFGRRVAGNQGVVFLAVESRAVGAGFANIACVPTASRHWGQRFVTQTVRPDTQINTDGGPEWAGLTAAGLDHDDQVVAADPLVVDRWLPWVHKLISNAKASLVGTYHGVRRKYLGWYLAEYLYRFNRRWWPAQLFDRTVTAVCGAGPIRYADVTG